MTELLTVQQAAERLLADESTVRRWIRSGRLTAHRPGRRLLVPEDAITRLLHDTTVTPETATAGAPVPRPVVPPRTSSVSGTFRERAQVHRRALPE